MTAALVAIQLEIGPDVLASADVYRRALEAAAERALAPVRARARLVVFPELAGHLALYALAPERARRASTLSGALAAAALRRPLAVLRGAATGSRLGARQAVLGALAPDGERWWKSVFGPLARRHAAFVVAGSHLRLGADGELTNTSLLFAPDGRLVATTDKVNLVPGMEDAARGGLGLARGNADRLPIVDSGVPELGKIATLVCYDGFIEPHTALERFEPLGLRLAARGGADVIANPAANPWPWREIWPLDRDTRPAGPRLRRDQWQAEGLPATLAANACARYGVTAHLVGRVLDLHFDGQSEILEREATRGVRVLARAERCDRGDHLVVEIG